MIRRLPALVLLVAALVGVVMVQTKTPDPEPVVFSSGRMAWMPAVPSEGHVVETWFCPGIPIETENEVDGEIVIANRTDGVLQGDVIVLTDSGQSQRIDLNIAPWATSEVDLSAVITSGMAGAVVEVEQGGALVEQVSSHPSGDSTAPCANQTSSEWYLADGFTIEGSVDKLLLTNPFDQTVVANIEFATVTGHVAPKHYSGLTIPPQSIRVVDLGAAGAGAQSEPQLAVEVHVTRGQLVVGRYQYFFGGGRLGADVSIAAPAPSTQWWFASGGRGVSEQFALYNAGERPAVVDVVFLGVDAALSEPISIPDGEVKIIDTASLVSGPHAAVLATSSVGGSIIVERVTTTGDDPSGTSAQMGAPPSPDGQFPQRWYVPQSPTEAVTEGLIILNADNTDGTVTVSAVGSSGPVPVPALTDIPIPAAGIVTVDLTDDLVFGRQLVIDSTTRVFVERSLPTGRDGVRNTAWAIPQR